MMSNYSRDTEFTNLFSILALLRAVNIWRGKIISCIPESIDGLPTPFSPCRISIVSKLHSPFFHVLSDFVIPFFLFLVMFDALMAVEIDRGLKYL